jgi:hypothetical protein
MKKILLILMLLGVITLGAKPKYRIETWVDNGVRHYLPQKKVWYRTNYFYLPFKVWKSGSYSFQHQSQAEEIIQNWKMDYQAKIDYKQSEFIIVE